MVENKLVFAYAYWVNSACQENQPGYFVGNPNEPIKGRFEGRNNLLYAAAKAADLSSKLSTPVDMGFEGLAQDDKMTLLLQPIKASEVYIDAEVLARRYLSE